jgi:hypothetical protein
VNPNEHPDRVDEPQVVEPKPPEQEYLAPNTHPASGRNWRAAGGTAIGFAVIAAKFKGLLFALLNFKWIFLGAKFGLTAVSFLASIWFYALFFGWKFAIVFVLLIAIHECGHAIFVRGYGLSAPGIYFIPGLGAFTTWSGTLQNAYQEAVIAFGGPLLGTIGSAMCLGLGLATRAVLDRRGVHRLLPQPHQHGAARLLRRRTHHGRDLAELLDRRTHRRRRGGVRVSLL